MDKTLDILPGEGEKKTVTSVRTRRVCSECEEPAHYKQSFLLQGTRGNPASQAYSKNDCSWCSDLDIFVCKEHQQINTPDGYVRNSTFPASKQFAHMFLYWETQS